MPTIIRQANGRGRVNPHESPTQSCGSSTCHPQPAVPTSPSPSISNTTMLPMQTQFQDTFFSHLFQPDPYSSPTNKPVLGMLQEVCCSLIGKLVAQVCSVCENSPRYRPTTCSLLCMWIKLRKKSIFKSEITAFAANIFSSSNLSILSFILHEFVSLIFNPTLIIPLSMFLIATNND